MKLLWKMAFVVALVAVAGRLWGGVPAATQKRDPEEAFRQACARLVALGSKQALLKGVTEIKPTIERDKKGRLKSALFVFARNAVPPGKQAARAKDASAPFVYVSVALWSGRSQQPPAALHEFEWKGQIYQMWVRAFASDAALVKTVRKTVDEPVLAPQVPKRQKQPTLRLKTTQPLQAFRKGMPLVFEGLADVPIHRPAPEHFKITRVSDGQRVSLHVAYDREKIEPKRPGVQARAAMATGYYAYNSLFKGTRLFLYNGVFRDRDPIGHADILNLYGYPRIEPGVRYRLTWACWPVGATSAAEVSCEFELGK